MSKEGLSLQEAQKEIERIFKHARIDASKILKFIDDIEYWYRTGQKREFKADVMYVIHDQINLLRQDFIDLLNMVELYPALMDRTKKKVVTNE